MKYVIHIVYNIIRKNLLLENSKASYEESIEACIPHILYEHMTKKLKYTTKKTTKTKTKNNYILYSYIYIYLFWNIWIIIIIYFCLNHSKSDSYSIHYL